MRPILATTLPHDSDISSTIPSPAAVSGDYLIHSAIRNTDLTTLKLLLLNVENLSVKNKDGLTGIYLAATLNFWDVVIFIAEEKPSIYSNEEDTVIDCHTARQHNDKYQFADVLLSAAKENNTEAFMALWKTGVRKAVKDNSTNEEAIHYAVRNNNREILKVLLRSKEMALINLSTQNSLGQTPMALAIALGHWDLVVSIAEQFSLLEDVLDKIKYHSYRKYNPHTVRLEESRTICYGPTSWNAYCLSYRQDNPFKSSLDIIKKDFANALEIAISNNQTDVLHALLKAGAPAHQKPLFLQTNASNQSAMFGARQVTKPAEPSSKRCCIS